MAGGGGVPWYDDPDKLRAEVARVSAQGPAPVERDRWVGVVCDPGADGLWSQAGARVQPEALPVTLDLMARLHRWRDLFGDNTGWDRGGRRWTLEQDRSWGSEGFAIAMALKRELPSWTVVYRHGWWGVAAGHPPTQDQLIYYEYEVTEKLARTGRSSGVKRAGPGTRHAVPQASPLPDTPAARHS